VGTTRANAKDAGQSAWHRRRGLLSASVVAVSVSLGAGIGLGAAVSSAGSSSATIRAAGGTEVVGRADAKFGGATTPTTNPTNIASLQQTLATLQGHQEAMEQQLAQLRKLDAAGGTADPAAMFELQIRMQTASQYIEACSNVMSAIHNEMIGLARATKGR